jgi:putative tricarboxylic transport membrane protein
MSQALLMCEDAKKTIRQVEFKGKDVWRFLPTMQELRRIRLTMARSSVIGIFIGILPGAGGDIGSWVSYNEAKRFSKQPQEFGKGSINGISASETANNAVTGSSLIPLLTLGIPGSATAAILLGALIIHGLLPGRTLFTDNAHITYTVIFGFLFANIFMGIVGMAIGRHMSHITRLPNFILIPMIIALSVVGSFSLGNNFFDVFTMLFFGLLGYLMRKSGFPPAPLILGLILGPIAETGFRQSLILSDGPVILYILSNPISLILFAATILSILSAVWVEYRRS